jgi:hypothetical protein
MQENFASPASCGHRPQGEASQSKSRFKHCKRANMWDAGHLAIVSNVVGAQSRDHDHCILFVDQGLRDSGPNDRGRSGWGGRIASAANGFVVALTHTPREFCNGAHVSGDVNLFDNSNRISAADMRRISLYEADPSRNPEYDRTMKSYYA